MQIKALISVLPLLLIGTVEVTAAPALLNARQELGNSSVSTTKPTRCNRRPHVRPSKSAVVTSATLAAPAYGSSVPPTVVETGLASEVFSIPNETIEAPSAVPEVTLTEIAIPEISSTEAAAPVTPTSQAPIIITTPTPTSTSRINPIQAIPVTNTPRPKETSPPINNGQVSGGVAGAEDETNPEKFVKYHNAFRARYGAPEVKWNTEMASAALDWAGQCTWGHSKNGYAENAAASGPPDDDPARSATDMWGGEEKNYNFEGGEHSGVVGHFENMVWKTTTDVGCANVKCPKETSENGNSVWYMIVCDYTGGKGGPEENINKALA